jgi:hypothetical protein
VPLSFTLRVAPPFSLDVTTLSLQPGEAGSVMVAFDPNYRYLPGGFEFARKYHCLLASLVIVFTPWSYALFADSGVFTPGTQPSAPMLQPACVPSPHIRHDLKSHIARQQLLVAYTDNPQTDALELVGEVEFPNLVLDAHVRNNSADEWLRAAGTAMSWFTQKPNIGISTGKRDSALRLL